LTVGESTAPVLLEAMNDTSGEFSKATTSLSVEFPGASVALTMTSSSTL
jgi:hypothetical protein